jgi:hypothetical protein
VTVVVARIVGGRTASTQAAVTRERKPLVPRQSARPVVPLSLAVLALSLTATIAAATAWLQAAPNRTLDSWFAQLAASVMGQ